MSRSKQLFSVFGTNQPNANASLVSTNTILKMSPGCNPGTENDFTEICAPCPVGTYSSSSGATCQLCPGESTSSVVGAKSILQCDICKANTCGRGSCSLRAFQAVCTCPSGFRGPRCEENVLAIVFGVLIGTAVVIVGGFLAFRRYRRVWTDTQTASHILAAESRILSLSCKPKSTTFRAVSDRAR